MKILVVDDEALLVKGIRFNLQNEGYEVITGSDGLEAVRAVQEQHPDLVVLDVMMPNMDGLTACAKIREFSDVPIIMLTAKVEDMDKLMGFEHGADDYLTKPFDAGELLARLRALLRRRGELAEPEGTCYGDITLQSDSRTLLCGERSVKLGQKEYQLMEVLLAYRGHVAQKDVLAEKVWGVEDISEYNNVEVYVSFLRKKLGYLRSKTQIKAVRGVGYALEKLEGLG